MTDEQLAKINLTGTAINPLCGGCGQEVAANHLRTYIGLQVYHNPCAPTLQDYKIAYESSCLEIDRLRARLEAAEAASELAKGLPFAPLAPQTLVWKLAGLVSLAATGEDDNHDHTFKVGELPSLFEQLVVQLQDLPLPPSPVPAVR